jgi:hypothetical protein
MSRTSEINKDDLAVEWLLKSENAAIRYWTLTDILGRTKTDPDVVLARDKISSWSPIAQYLGEQHPAGYWADAEDV